MAPEVFFLYYDQDEGVDLCYKRNLSQGGVCWICSKFILGWPTSVVAKRRTLGGPRGTVHIPLIRVYSDYSLVSRYTAL